LLLAACSFLPSRQFAFEFPAQDRPQGEVAIAALPVLLTDHTGSVVGLDEAPNGMSLLIDQGMPIDPAHPNAVILQWDSGPCDTSVRIDVTQSSGTVDILVTTIFKPVPCEAIGIVRDVMITLSGPADPARIGVRFTPQPEEVNT
jgi:hypothetical protein